MKATKVGSVVALVASAVCGSVNSARAWESDTASEIRTMPRMLDAGRAFLPQEWSNRRFYIQFLKDTIGTELGDESPALTKVFRCPLGKTTGDVAGCGLAGASDLDHIGTGWLNVRRNAEVRQRSEHTLIARRAAEFAGLIPATALFEPFWVRYPAANELVGSKRGDLDKLIVTQSLRPVAAVPDDFSYATRSISLLEFSQTPDYSFNLADWANGNETCPLIGIEGAYRDLHVTEACHNFRMAMGTLNVNHFAPLNREMWRYYHSLALNKMDECNALSGIKAEFYDRWSSFWLESKLGSDEHTETHECERLAMAYEMFGQHFLQDSWAVGHMWQRWGYPNLQDFPADVTFLGSTGSGFPLENLAPRRALIGALVGAFSGSLHGAKSFMVRLVRGEQSGYVRQQITDALTRFGALDDPLNGGHYNVGIDVEWSDSDARYPGAGDLQWDPVLRSLITPVVSTDSAHEEQRKRLLTCSAASMRNVYDAGPHAHGLPAPASNQVLATNPDSEWCWNHWATNSSMYAALGPLNLKYDVTAVTSTLTRIVLAVANLVVLPQVGGVPNDGKSGLVNFPRERLQDIAPSSPKYALAEDRDRILRDAMSALMLDTARFEGAYLANRLVDSNGTQSAHQQLADGSSLGPLLGVPPVPMPSGAPAVPRGVEYVDKPPGPTPSDAELAMSRVFWRGDLHATCEAALADGAAVVNDLREECTVDAALGGDPEACTACAALAELLIPTCNGFSDGIVRDSKCSAVGVGQRGSAAPGLPEWWWDNTARALHNVPPPWNGASVELCVPSYHLAAQWCANAPNDLWDANADFTHVNDDYVPSSTLFCPDTFGGRQRSWGTWTVRNGAILSEGNLDPGRPWVIPMVSAWDERLTTTPGQDPCLDATQTTTTRRLREQASLGSANATEYIDAFYAGPTYPRCGVTQQVWVWNRACGPEVWTQVDFSIPPLQQEDPATGALALQLLASGGTECYLRAPRRFVDCPLGLECTPGGECVVPRSASATFLDLNPPPAEPAEPPGG